MRDFINKITDHANKIRDRTETPIDLIEEFTIYHDFLITLNDQNSLENQNLQNIDIPVYYINLQRSVERENYMQEQIKKYNITNVTRIEAIDGKKLNNKIEYTSDFNELTNNEVACTLSHLSAIKRAYDNDLSEVLIVEDDVSFILAPFWSKKLSEYIADAYQFSPDWTFLKLFSNYETDLTYDMRLNSINATSYILPTYNTLGTVAYIINRKGMENLLEKVYYQEQFVLSKSLAGWGTSDFYIYKASLNNKVILINPPLVFPDNRNMLSNIHDDHTTDHIKLAIAIMQPYITKIFQN